MIALEAVRAQVLVLVGVKDLTILPTGDQEDIISKALVRYSRLRPIRKASAMTGLAGAVYSYPSDFEAGFSKILEVEYPVGKVPKETIALKYYDEDYTPTGKVIRFNGCNPSAGETWWLKYTTAHRFTSAGEAEEIPESHQPGFEYLCASITCTKLATFYASKANPSLPGVEIVAFNERVAEYSSMANKWMEKFNSEISQEVTGIIGQVKFGQEMFFDRDDE